MNIKFKELIYIGLTLVLLAILGISYLALNKKSSSNKASSSQIPTSAKLSTQIPAELESLLTDLEKDPSREKLAKAQIAVNKLTNNTQKETLQNRLNKVKAKLNLVDSTEKALVNAENSPSEKTIKAAQDAINRISIPAKKAEFQKRLDRVKNRLSKASSEGSSTSEQEESTTSTTTESSSERDSQDSPSTNNESEETRSNTSVANTEASNTNSFIETPVTPADNNPSTYVPAYTPSTPSYNTPTSPVTPTPSSSESANTEETPTNTNTEETPSSESVDPSSGELIAE